LWKPDSFFYGCFFDDLFYVHLLSCHQTKWQKFEDHKLCCFFFCAFGWIEVKS
jgi:hypothetical protein